MVKIENLSLTQSVYYFTNYFIRGVFRYKFPKNFILFKYEDFVCDTRNQIKRLIKYLQKFIKIQLSEEIIDQIIKDTSFENLKNLEKKGYFLENSKKTKFFYLGPQNDYTKFLDKKIQYKIEEKFESTMKKLKYLQ